MQFFSRKRRADDEFNVYPAFLKRPYLSGYEFSNAIQSRESRKKFLDQLHDQIILEKEDKKMSKKLVDSVLRTILKSVCQQEGGHIYQQVYVDAGSYPIKAKIGKADEFDVNIPMNVNVKKARLDSAVNYQITENRNQQIHHALGLTRIGFSQPNRTENRNKKRELVSSFMHLAPAGYAVLEVGKSEENSSKPNYLQPFYSPDDIFKITGARPIVFRSRTVHETVNKIAGSSAIGPCSYTVHSNVTEDKSKQLPEKFVHRQPNALRFYGIFTQYYDDRNIVNRSQLGNIELLPYDVKEDLYNKISNTPIAGLTVSPTSHGPALKLTIQPQTNQRVTHHINVDVTASVKVNIPLSRFAWPRPKSIFAFGESVQAAVSAGTHLVPKQDLFWAVSFSRVERALLSKVDRNHGCRKYVYRLMKKFVRTFKSSLGHTYNEMSHSIKTQILWSCEHHGRESEYWSWTNRDICLMNTMREYVRTIQLGTQQDYFNTRINILQGKDAQMRHELAGLFQNEIRKLEQM